MESAGQSTRAREPARPVNGQEHVTEIWNWPTRFPVYWLVLCLQPLHLKSPRDSQKLGLGDQYIYMGLWRRLRRLVPTKYATRTMWAFRPVELAKKGRDWGLGTGSPCQGIRSSFRCFRWTWFSMSIPFCCRRRRTENYDAKRKCEGDELRMNEWGVAALGEILLAA